MFRRVPPTLIVSQKFWEWNGKYFYPWFFRSFTGWKPCGFPLSRDGWKNLMTGKNRSRVPFLIFHPFEQILDSQNLGQKLSADNWVLEADQTFFVRKEGKIFWPTDFSLELKKMKIFVVFHRAGMDGKVWWRKNNYSWVLHKMTMFPLLLLEKFSWIIHCPLLWFNLVE